MTYDELNQPVEEPDFGRLPGPEVGGGRPIADREVPVPTGRATTPLLHQWLDGDIQRAAVVTSGEGDSVELWTRINQETELLRSRTTPLYVQKRIMDALPDDMYQLNLPWWKRTVVVKRPAAVAAAAALVGLGVVLARLAAR